MLATRLQGDVRTRERERYDPQGQPRSSWAGVYYSLLPRCYYSLLAYPLGFRRSVRPIIPVLGRADIRHPPLMAIPSVEAVHLEGPETGTTGHDEAVGVPHIHTERALDRIG